jgi:hypothetical protein
MMDFRPDPKGEKGSRPDLIDKTVQASPPAAPIDPQTNLGLTASTTALRLRRAAVARPILEHSSARDHAPYRCSRARLRAVRCGTASDDDRGSVWAFWRVPDPHFWDRVRGRS